MTFRFDGLSYFIKFSPFDQSLPHVHTNVFCESRRGNNPQIIEITKDKQVVWEFDEFELVRNELACWQILEAKAAKRLRNQFAD